MCHAKLSNNFFVKYKSQPWKAGRTQESWSGGCQGRDPMAPIASPY